MNYTPGDLALTVEYYNRRGKKRETRHDLNDFRRMAAKSLPIAD